MNFYNFYISKILRSSRVRGCSKIGKFRQNSTIFHAMTSIIRLKTDFSPFQNEIHDIYIPIDRYCYYESNEVYIEVIGGQVWPKWSKKGHQLNFLDYKRNISKLYTVGRMKLGPLKIGTFRFLANLENAKNWDFRIFSRLKTIIFFLFLK